MKRTPLLMDQSPVPVDWPRRVGYPPPGVTRVSAYPAGGPPNPKKPKSTVDAVYPRSAIKLAKAHAWMFPGKRIQSGGRVLSTATDFDLKRALIEGLARVRDHGPITPERFRSYMAHESDLLDKDDPLVGRHVFSDAQHRNTFAKSFRQSRHLYDVMTRDGRGYHTALVVRRRPQGLDALTQHFARIARAAAVPPPRVPRNRLT